jgi:HD-like signal output (HDOD) protein
LPFPRAAPDSPEWACESTDSTLIPGVLVGSLARVPMKQRKLLSAAEVSELYKFLDGRLDSLGLPSQPEVALKLLELSRNPNSQLTDYSKIIKNDQAISGRVLRLANSAFFAQRKAVTALDRACVVLGIERLKAVSLGFHLTRAAAVPADKDYSRRIWGESLYRACLASELARVTAPSLVSEAFVVGLMMDAGLPLMMKLAGEPFRAVRDANASPGRLYRLEFDELPFTHVDVVTAMVRKWKFPDLLAKPLELHHTKPPEARRDDPLSRLHRIAYVVGLVELTVPRMDGKVQEPTTQTPGVATAQRLLSLTDQDMASTVKRSFSEYGMSIEMFSEVAQGLTNVESLMEAVQVGLAHAIDDVMERELQADSADKPMRLQIAGQPVELVKDSVAGGGIAYLYDSHGSRLLSHRFDLGHADAIQIAQALGLDSVKGPDIAALRETLMKLAA